LQSRETGGLMFEISAYVIGIGAALVVAYIVALAFD
jgi:hypothetical protein